MSSPVNPIPKGYHTVTPYIVVEDAAKLCDFLEAGLGATNVHRMLRPDGGVGHAEATIGDSRIMIGGAMAGYSAMPCMLYLYVNDCDALYKRAIQAGATSIMEPADQFYGDRNGAVKDFAGNHWYFATHVEDVAPDEMTRRANARYKQMSAS